MTYQKVSASGVIMNQEGKILLVQRSEQDDFLPGIFGLPGGGTDFLEDPVEGLKREIKEECGISIDVQHPLKAFSFVMPHEGVEKHTVEIIYLCKLTKAQKIKLSFEHSDYKWLSFDEIAEIKTTEFIINLVKDLRSHPLIIGA